MYHKIREAQMGDRDEGGFTLIELLVVVIIIGILAAIAIPVFLNQRRKAWDANAKSDVKNMVTAEESYLTDSADSTYTNDVALLEAEGFTPSSNVLHDAEVYNGGGTAGDSYVVCAKHEQSTNTYYFDSQAGEITTDEPTTATCTPA